MGVVTLGVGPFNVPSLVEGATADDCLALTRLWLSDDLPKNSESRVLGVITRALTKSTSVKFLVAYADPAEGVRHLGTIYQAAGWLYTGLSEAMPLYDIGDGVRRHSRSLSHAYGTHSVKHFKNHGIAVQVIPQQPKHRYIRFLDLSWRLGYEYRSCHIRRRRSLIKTIDLPLNQLRGAPWNPNVLDSHREQKLRASLGKYGLVQFYLWLGPWKTATR